MDKPLPSEFMKSGLKAARMASLPTMVVTALARSEVPGVKTAGTRNIAFSVTSLDKLASAYEEKERLLKKR